MSESILFEVKDRIAKITLNRPDKLNSFNAEMHGALKGALDRVGGSPARVLLLTGSGRGFCAGQDLSDRSGADGDGPPDLGISLEKHYNPLILSLRKMEMPVLCAVNGVAAGAGANLALACDIVIAARSASFLQAFCKIGLVPDSGGTYFLPRLVGTARAAGLALLGEKITAEQAEAWGLIWRCVDDEELPEKALALARRLADAPTRGLALIKRALNASGGHTLEQQLELERELQGRAGRTRDYREGVAAFLEKRKPDFQGK